MTTEFAPTNDQTPTETLSEELLEAWLKLILNIRGNRALNQLTFNQMAICHFVAKHEAAGETDGVSQSNLCKETKLLKSQMNKELSDLEKMGILKRQPNPNDKRCTLVSFADRSIYQDEHDHVLKLFGVVVEYMGTDPSHTLAIGMDRATDIAKQVIDNTQA